MFTYPFHRVKMSRKKNITSIKTKKNIRERSKHKKEKCICPDMIRNECYPQLMEQSNIFLKKTMNLFSMKLDKTIGFIHLNSVLILYSKLSTHIVLCRLYRYNNWLWRKFSSSPPSHKKVLSEEWCIYKGFGIHIYRSPQKDTCYWYSC